MATASPTDPASARQTDSQAIRKQVRPSGRNACVYLTAAIAAIGGMLLG